MAHVFEDRGAHYGRSEDWPAIPQTRYRGTPACSSTDVVCMKCGSPWGGLRLDAETGDFVHRERCKYRDRYLTR